VTNPVSLPSFHCMYDIPLLLYSLQHYFFPHTIGPTNFSHPSPAQLFKTSQQFLTYFPKCPRFSTIKIYAPTVTFISSFLKFKSKFLVKRTFVLSKAAFAMAIQYLISMTKAAFNKNKALFTSLSLYGRIILKRILQKEMEVMYEIFFV